MKTVYLDNFPLNYTCCISVILPYSQPYRTGEAPEQLFDGTVYG